MEVVVNGKKAKIQRIADLPEQKVIRVFVPSLVGGPIVLKDKAYGSGILGRTQADFKKTLQQEIAKRELPKEEKK